MLVDVKKNLTVNANLEQFIISHKALIVFWTLFYGGHYNINNDKQLYICNEMSQFLSAPPVCILLGYQRLQSHLQISSVFNTKQNNNLFCALNKAIFKKYLCSALLYCLTV